MAAKKEETTLSSKKETALQVMADINKHFKRAVVTPACSFPERKRIPIGNPVVDYCMGGGFPVGCIAEYYGPESSGKTYNAMLAIIKFQKYDWGNNECDSVVVETYKEHKIKTKLKNGEEITTIAYSPDKVRYNKRGGKMKYVAIVDVEGTYDKLWGEYLGIDNKLLLRIVPQSGEEAIDVADALLRNPDISLVVFDSVAVTKAAAEIEKPMEDQTMGMQARFWNRAAAKFQNAMNSNDDIISLILINRSYDKVGLVFGNPEVVSSGSGLKYAKSVSIKFTGMKEEKAEIEGIEVTLGRPIKVENKKNKTARPFKSGQYYFCLADDPDTGLKYGETDVPNDMTEMGVLLGHVTKVGNSYVFGRAKLGSRDKFVEYLRKNKATLNILVDKIVNHV